MLLLLFIKCFTFKKCFSLRACFCELYENLAVVLSKRRQQLPCQKVEKSNRKVHTKNSQKDMLRLTSSCCSASRPQNEVCFARRSCESSGKPAPSASREAVATAQKKGGPALLDLENLLTHLNLLNLLNPRVLQYVKVNVFHKYKKDSASLTDDILIGYSTASAQRPLQLFACRVIDAIRVQNKAACTDTRSSRIAIFSQEKCGTRLDIQVRKPLQNWRYVPTMYFCHR